MSNFNNRQDFEMGKWPELREGFNNLIQLVWGEKELSEQFKQELFTMASLTSGCTHCQSHGAFHLNEMGAEKERIRDIWTYATSDSFTEAERAAFDLIIAAGQRPKWNHSGAF